MSDRQDGAERWILTSTILASSMAFIDSSALNVALPALQEDLGAGGAEILWIVNGYLLMLAALVLVGGALGDRLGRKRVFMAGIGVFLAASLLCGLAPTSLLLIIARVAQGAGAALMIPGSLAIISASFPPERRGQAIGTWSAATTLVTVGGPVLGGLLAEAGLWRWVFLINLPIGVAALLILATRVPESRDEQAQGGIDYLGAALTVVALAGLTYGFLTAPDLGFTSPQVALALLAGAAALVGFVVVEARSPHPMVPLGLFASRTFSGTNLLTLFLYGALTVGLFFLSLNLVQAQGYSPSLAGLAYLPFSLLLAVLSRTFGGLVGRFGARLLLTVGPALATAGLLLLALVGETGGPADYWTTYFPGIMVFGLGMAITVAPLTATVMGAVATHYAGTASGINNAVARTAGVLATAIVGAAALAVFQGALAARTAPLDLPEAARAAVLAQASQLGAAAVPEEVPPERREVVAAAIRGAFVETTRAVLLVCAALAGASAAMAALLVEGRRPETLVQEAQR